ncbi:MAG: hypothetical protein FWD53_02080 [Phycisphaerales bacterium]|nr:hypothetical protein [Phycisphaerales bacterium]
MQRKIAAIAVMAIVGTVACGEEDAKKMPFTVSKETTRITEPLRADGKVDYVKALNERYGKGVKAEENAFVGYLEIVGTEALNPRICKEVLWRCSGAETPKDAVLWESDRRFSFAGNMEEATGREELCRAMESPWNAEKSPEVADYLAKREKLLDAAVVVAERERWWLPSVASGEPEMISVLLPRLAPVRELVEGLCARAMLRANSSDFNGFMTDVIAAKRLARHVGSGATLIERLIGIASNAQVNITIGGAVGSGTWNPEQCGKLGAAIRELPPISTPADAIDTCERWCILDTVVYMSQQKYGEAGTVMKLFEANAFFNAIDQNAMNYDRVLKMVNELYDDFLAATREPTIAQVETKFAAIRERIETWNRESKNGGTLRRQANETEAEYTERIGRAIVAFLAPVLERAEPLYRRNCQEEAMLEVLLAAAAYRGKTGNWPAELKVLLPEYLNAVPKDAFSENGATDVEYVRTERGVMLRSAAWKVDGAEYRIELGAK